MRLPLVAALVASLIAATCGGPQTGTRKAQVLTNARVYVAVGASESVGVGSDHPEHDAWTAILYRSAFPQDAVFYNFARPGSLVSDALQDQLPQALAVHPDLVTVWLNTNDLVHSVPTATYRSELQRLVHALRQDGHARVLVANTPVLRTLPAIRNKPAAPPPDTIDAAVGDYNQAIASVVQEEAAVLVDLNCQGDMATLHPNWVSADGFHPNTNGYRAIALAFRGALAGRSCTKVP
jgi:acyl-CoA thioesterase-1